MHYVVFFLYQDLLIYMFVLCCSIPVWVFVLLLWQIFGNFAFCSLKSESNWIEFAWTVVPCSLVGFLCFLNLRCIAINWNLPFSVAVKVVGRQWYWSYDIEGGDGQFDSLILDFVDSVDKPLRLDFGTNYRFLVTSSDVLHSFAVTSLGLKVDAIPGRINQAYFMPAKLGVYVGYCSELCGAGHAYMPIVVEIVKGLSNGDVGY